MNTSIRGIYVAIAALMALVQVQVAAEKIQEKRAVTQNFMRQKLVYSQGILEGLTLENFGMISQNAMKMGNMNTSNLFLIVNNKDYLKRITNYQADINGLVKAASDQNLARAQKAYQNVIGRCVDCHQYFRTAQRRAHSTP